MINTGKTCSAWNAFVKTIQHFFSLTNSGFIGAGCLAITPEFVKMITLPINLLLT